MLAARRAAAVGEAQRRWPQRTRRARMRQTSVLELLSQQSSSPNKDLCFVDLFCGIGGASEGARQAGLEVVLAVDSNKALLDVHELNHPCAQHLCARLPVAAGELPLPAGQRFWLHGSPPCQVLSKGNKHATAQDRSQAAALVHWFVDFALASGCAVWSMEQAPAREVVDFLEDVRRRPGNRARVAYTVVDFVEIGLPQNRRRLIAGSPEVVARLERAPRVSRSVADVIYAPGGTHVRNRAVLSYRGPRDNPTSKLLRRTIKDYCRGIDGPSHTVTATSLRWVSPHLKRPVHGPLTVEDTQLLQSFPLSYSTGPSARLARLGVANALPPLVLAAMAGTVHPSAVCAESSIVELRRATGAQ